MSNWCWASIVFAVLASLAGRASAQGDGAPSSQTVQECARAYEDSQEHRGTGAFSAARLEFERCRRDDCPEFIRSDCARWSKEVEAQQPTVIFSARRGSRELTQVRVSTGDRVLLERLNDRAIALDPGEYDFRFETPEGGLVVQHALIQAGNKDRLVQVAFAPEARSHSAKSPAPSPPRAATTQRRSHAEPAAKPIGVEPGPRVLPWVLLAVGAASIGMGTALSVSGHSEEGDLRDTCSPHCTDAQVAPVHSKYLLSDISFGVGLVSLTAAAYLFLRPSDSEQAAKGRLPVIVVASPSAIQAAYGARF